MALYLPVKVSLKTERVLPRANLASVMMRRTAMMMKKMFLEPTIPRITPI